MVQCGIGRTGNFFAFESSKVKPDIVPIAKGLVEDSYWCGFCGEKAVQVLMHLRLNFWRKSISYECSNAVLDQFLKEFLKY